MGALQFVSLRNKKALPADTRITGEVGIGPILTGFAIQVQLTIRVPGMERAVIEDLVQQAHIVCLYSNATRGNIDVTLVIAD